MSEEFNAKRVEAEENLLIDYQFLLQDVMARKGVTLSELADRAGLSKGRVSQIMGPEANPTVKTFARLFHALGEEIVPLVKPKVRERETERVTVVEWAPFEHTEGGERPAAVNADLVALLKTDQFASNDNVVVMHADLMMTLEAA